MNNANAAVLLAHVSVGDLVTVRDGNGSRLTGRVLSLTPVVARMVNGHKFVAGVSNLIAVRRAG